MGRQLYPTLLHESRQFNVVSLADEYVLDRLRQPVIRRLLTEQQYIMTHQQETRH
jgi:hypothetical protein